MLIYSFLSLSALVVALLGLLDRSPYQQQPYYAQTLEALASADWKLPPAAPLEAGWARVNITPETPTPMAGYTPRSAFSAIEDSLFARVLWLRAGGQEMAFVSVDLLLFPPKVKQRLALLMAEKGKEVPLYLAATHTHNGIGGWDDSFAGRLSMGKYSEELVTFLAEKLLHCLEVAQGAAQSAEIAYFQADASRYVKNRLDIESPSDGWLRGLKVTKRDSTTALLTVFGAHPTSLPRKSTYLSNDYPGAFIANLEAHPEVDFALFMAGMVGSQGLTKTQGHDLDKVAFVGKTLDQILMDEAVYKDLGDSLALFSRQFPLVLPPSQMHLGNGVVVRNWLHQAAFGTLEGEITLTKIGKVVFMGVPADFSGELYLEKLAPIAAQNGLQLVVTGFNGGYIGYLVEGKHFNHSDKEEVTIMNWLGPQSGEYVTEIMGRLLEKTSE